MELFIDRGYASTTVGDIAERAGVTERTFFRYFQDKREVLFSGSKELESALVGVVTSAPKGEAPFQIVASAFEVVGAELQARRELAHVRARYAIVMNNPELQERELIKMASLGAAVSKALLARGVTEPTASLMAEAGLAVFKVGFERWVNAKKPGELAKHIRAAVDALRDATAADAPVPRRKV